eukprot:355640-Chlamydomonas_euryale.AAC.4
MHARQGWGGGEAQPGAGSPAGELRCWGCTGWIQAAPQESSGAGVVQAGARQARRRAQVWGLYRLEPGRPAGELRCRDCTGWSQAAPQESSGAGVVQAGSRQPRRRAQ